MGDRDQATSGRAMSSARIATVRCAVSSSCSEPESFSGSTSAGLADASHPSSESIETRSWVNPLVSRELPVKRDPDHDARNGFLFGRENVCCGLNGFEAVIDFFD